MAGAIQITTPKSETGTTNPLAGKSTEELIREAVPIIVGAVCVLALLLTMQRADMIVGWTAEYDGVGNFVVEGCAEDAGLGADQWRCSGTLYADDASDPLPSTLVTSSGALVSDRPFVGEQFNVFFKPEQVGSVFPEADRLNELTRLYLSLLTQLLLLFGAAIWLAGWFSTRDLDAGDESLRETIRFPQRFQWRSRGATWMVFGLLTTVANYVLVTKIIGSLGIV